jgi:biofilm PGA synthesis protein PgaA
LLAQARAERAAGHRLNALAHCQQILAQWPDDVDAKALNVSLLGELGATARAIELSPDAAPLERSRLQADEAAKEIRSSRGEPADPHQPYAEADKAVADLKRFDDPATQATDALRQRARFDALVALDQADRPAEVVAGYEAMRKANVEPPAYAKRAVADAMEQQRKPKLAAKLYEESIKQDPGPYAADESQPRIGLMYAYLDSGQTDKAFATIDALAASEPKWITVPGVRAPVQNPRKVEADTNAALLREYVDMPAAAWGRLSVMSAEAPLNGGIRRELGMTELARGWPRRAQDTLAIARTIDARDVESTLGEADAKRALTDYEGIEQDIRWAEAQADRNRRVQRARQDWDREQGWQFDISHDNGKGNSPDYGDRDEETQATLGSPLIADHWRILALARSSSADLPEGDVERTRLGVGVRGYARGLEAYVQVLPSTDRYVNRTAVEAGVNWAVSDQWKVAADYSTAGEDVPLRAQYYGISAKTLDTSVTWRASELTSAKINVAHDTFSDGNERNAWLATLQQRVLTAPHRFIDAGLEVGGSRNSDTDRPYFDPRQDYSYALTGRFENLLSQFYERQWRQRIDVAVGQYAEKGFATGWMASARYGQTFAPRNGISFGWGLGWHNQPYDGKRESRVVLDLTMHWGE